MEERDDEALVAEGYRNDLTMRDVELGDATPEMLRDAELQRRKADTERLGAFIAREERRRLAVAFNEWQRRYEADPSQFTEIADLIAQGADYGECCADFLLTLLKETR